MNSSKLEGRSRHACADGTLGAHLRELAEDPSSPLRPGLVVQGGGLRGVYSLSALAVLEELGLRDAFSRVIGSSAGAINGAYFLAGQAGESISIYTEDLSNRTFVNPRRISRIVDVDFMIQVLRERHPLKFEKMLAAPATLYTVLTQAKTAEAEVVSNREPGYDPYETFRATAALPGLYNEVVPLNGNGYVDGGVAELVPLDLAFSSDPCNRSTWKDMGGPPEAVVLLTRGRSHQKRERNLLVRLLVAALMREQSASVRAKVCGSNSEEYNELMRRLDRESRAIPRRTWTLWPSNLDRLVNRTTTKKDLLRDCAEMARSDMFDLLATKRDVPFRSRSREDDRQALTI
jgi:predicted patatin/cPLA2 family phospholipase